MLPDFMLPKRRFVGAAALANVHTLSLSQTNVTDVGAALLGRVHTLDLSFATRKMGSHICLSCRPGRPGYMAYTPDGRIADMRTRTACRYTAVSCTHLLAM